MKFITEKQICFHHRDPAGIFFYPQFFYLLHEVQEDFLAHIRFPEHVLIKTGKGIPIMNLKTEFLRMCRYGDQLTLSLELTQIGNTSIGMQYEIFGGAAGGVTDQSIRLRAHGGSSIQKFATASRLLFLMIYEAPYFLFSKLTHPYDAKNSTP